MQRTVQKKSFIPIEKEKNESQGASNLATKFLFGFLKIGGHKKIYCQTHNFLIKGIGESNLQGLYQKRKIASKIHITDQVIMIELI